MEQNERPLDRRLRPPPLSVVLEWVAAPSGLSFPSAPPTVLPSSWKPPLIHPFALLVLTFSL